MIWAVNEFLIHERSREEALRGSRAITRIESHSFSYDNLISFFAVFESIFTFYLNPFLYLMIGT